MAYAFAHYKLLQNGIACEAWNAEQLKCYLRTRFITMHLTHCLT